MGQSWSQEQGQEKGSRGALLKPGRSSNQKRGAKEGPGKSAETSEHGSLPTQSQAHSQAKIGRTLPFIKERISFRIPSDIAYLDEILDYLNERMAGLGITDPDEPDVLIALDEAIVNAIKHGNKNDPAKTVHITAEMSAKCARFTVRDEGQGFCREGIPDPTDPFRLLIPSGRGLLLITHIMDKVHHNETGNEIRMVKGKPRPATSKHRTNGHGHK
ncbi:MAG TPA: ATP-binding protein [Blastocatellia bacterium]|nr:ATP-binding protein [Blastocatellia bacterium]